MCITIKSNSVGFYGIGLENSFLYIRIFLKRKTINNIMPHRSVSNFPCPFGYVFHVFKGLNSIDCTLNSKVVILYTKGHPSKPNIVKRLQMLFLGIVGMTFKTELYFICLFTEANNALNQNFKVFRRKEGRGPTSQMEFFYHRFGLHQI